MRGRGHGSEERCQRAMEDAIGRPGKRKREARRSVYSQYVKTFIKVNMIEGG